MGPGASLWNVAGSIGIDGAVSPECLGMSAGPSRSVIDAPAQLCGEHGEQDVDGRMDSSHESNQQPKTQKNKILLKVF
jgi:hypothetical protein